MAASEFLVPNQIVLGKNLRCKEELGELSPCSKLSKNSPNSGNSSTSKEARPPVLTDKTSDKASYKAAHPRVLTKHFCWNYEAQL